MKDFKLGQIFWMRDVNEFGGVGRSDFECKVIGIKDCKFLNGARFIDFLVEETRLNDYHESFKFKKSRTHEVSFRYDFQDKTLKYWHAQYWPGTVEEWRQVERQIFSAKPKNLRVGAHK